MAREYNELEIEELDEISGVDNPAQVGARAVIFKRHAPLAGDGVGGVASNESNTSGGTGVQENQMTDKTSAEKELDAVKKQLADQSAELAIAKAEGSLSDAERALYRGMDAAGQESFRKLSPEQRAEKVRAASESNPVIYTTLDGETFRKNDDPRLVSIAKRADEDRKALLAERVERKTDELRKRAGEVLKHFPKDEMVKVAALRALDTISDSEVRKSAIEMLKAGDDALAKAFEERGTSSGNPETGDAEEKLEKRAEEIRKQNPKLSQWDAYALAAEQNPDLIEQALGQSKE